MIDLCPCGAVQINPPMPIPRGRDACDCCFALSAIGESFPRCRNRRCLDSVCPCCRVGEIDYEQDGAWVWCKKCAPAEVAGE